MEPGQGSLVLAASGHSDFASLTATLANVGGSTGSIDYLLLAAGLGLDIGIDQVFTFVPFVHVGLEVAETGETIAQRA